MVPSMAYARLVTRLSHGQTQFTGKARYNVRSFCQASSHFFRSQDQTKRGIKQRLGVANLNLEDGDGVCAAYGLHYPVLLSEVAAAVKDSSFTATKRQVSIKFKTKGLQVFAGDVLHMPLQAREDSTIHYGHAFFFRSGAAVFWGLPLDLRRMLLGELSKHQEYESASFHTGIGGEVHKSSFLLKMEDFDHEFGYTVDPKLHHSTFRNDRIYLMDFSDPETLLAYSYGLAQSVKLLIYEEQIDSLVLRTRALPDELARDGKIKLSHKELKLLIGELLAARYSVNLVSDILDTPEYFWQHPELENLHMECAKQIELKQRARILDTRTQVIRDALDLLNNELSSSSSDRVERAILFLIAVEVSLEFARILPLFMQQQ